ncbi:MAG: SRPBCC family protein [Actinomycetota bacterium]
MTQSDVTVAVDIDAPPTKVWEVVEPIESHADWMADAAAIHFESEQTRGVGTTFVADTRVGPIRLRDRMQVTEWTPVDDDQSTGRMGVVHSGIVTGTGVFTIEPLDGGDRSRFSWSEQLDFPWYFAGRLGERIGGRFVLGPIWRRNLTRLKQLVES